MSAIAHQDSMRLHDAAIKSFAKAKALRDSFHDEEVAEYLTNGQFTGLFRASRPRLHREVSNEFKSLGRGVR